MHQSIATIDSPEFLNLQPIDINPLMSKCEIKILYVGENRNHTFIDKNVAAEMAKTLRGAPIVGYYKDKKQDFADHGQKVIIDDEGIKFECQTIPYGFVSPDAQVWFQDFEDVDESGNTVVHKYLMTTGYLWTDQYPQANLPLEQGRPQSMEFKKESLKGQWKTDYERKMDFFIISDAIFRKICILGDDVEPCFQGASVTAPEISTNFTLDDNFKHTLYGMMQDLRNVLKGGQQMGNDENTVVETAVENEVEQPESNFTQQNNMIADGQLDNESTPTDYAKKEDKDQDDKEATAAEEKEDDAEEKDNSNQETKKEDNDDNEEDDDKKKNSKYSLLEEELNNLKNEYTELKNRYQDLVNFKTQIDNQRKDALIAQFYMLSDADKADVIANKEKYTLDEIKSKLSVICFDKKVSFTLEKESNQEQKVTTYNLNENKNDSLPDWVKAVKEQQKLD